MNRKKIIGVIILLLYILLLIPGKEAVYATSDAEPTIADNYNEDIGQTFENERENDEDENKETKSEVVDGASEDDETASENENLSVNEGTSENKDLYEDDLDEYGQFSYDIESELSENEESGYKDIIVYNNLSSIEKNMTEMLNKIERSNELMKKTNKLLILICGILIVLSIFKVIPWIINNLFSEKDAGKIKNNNSAYDKNGKENAEQEIQTDCAEKRGNFTTPTIRHELKNNDADKQDSQNYNVEKNESCEDNESYKDNSNIVYKYYNFDAEKLDNNKSGNNSYYPFENADNEKEALFKGINGKLYINILKIKNDDIDLYCLENIFDFKKHGNNYSDTSNLEVINPAEYVELNGKLWIKSKGVVIQS